MSFRIVEIIDARPEGVVAKVSHQNNQITAVVATRQTDDLSVGSSIEAEIGYDKILDWNVISDFDDTKSGIWQEQDGVHLLGRVHNVLDYGDGKTIVDVYMQNGPEFFTVSSEVIDITDLESNGGLEIVVDNLYIYPSDK